MKIIVLLAILFSSSSAMVTDGDKIINGAGNVVQLKGISWFGFNNQGTMVNGLDSSDKLSSDFATQVHRMRLLGFNSVRLPFSFKDLQLAPRDFSRQCPSESMNQVLASVTNPSVPVSADIQAAPLPEPPADAKADVCNAYLPNDSTFNRFVWVVQFFAENGFYVLLDNHLREDQTALENQADWVQQWVKLVTAVSANLASREALLIDILNEPDNFGLKWETADGKPGLGDLYLAAMDALHPVNPKALFVIEGTGQGGVGANWGDGFATNPNVISQFGLSDPNPFFTALLKKSYRNHVVVSPHAYPPSVSHRTGDSGATLWNRLSTSFGYLSKDGYCSGSDCKVFPIAIGEFGSSFADQADTQWLNEFASYLNNEGAAADGKHNAIPNWYYWSWNPNSGDTGGVLADNWRDVIWVKIDYLAKIGLTPWYQGGNQGLNTVPNTDSSNSSSPTAMPSSESPTATPSSESPTATPSSESPTLTPSSVSPTSAPSLASPTLTPSSASPTVSPSSASPTVSPSSASPTVSPSSASPTEDPCAELPTLAPNPATPTKHISGHTSGSGDPCAGSLFQP